MIPGKVYLIGAGPGDIELLTIKAVRVLGEVDVVLIDDLVNREIFQFLQPDIEVIEVGKRGGCKSTSQLSIHDLMLKYAKAGYNVARLKGGDPYVFGRGAEEMQFLAQHGIAAEVISGVTAGVAVPASIGVPVTHRDCARSVTFVTGHVCNERPVNWRGIAAAGGTIVIYMGIAHLPEIVEELLAGGVAADMPVAVIQHGTLAHQRSITSTLAKLPEAVKEHQIGSPAIVVVGEVVDIANTTTMAVTEVNKILEEQL